MKFFCKVFFMLKKGVAGSFCLPPVAGRDLPCVRAAAANPPECDYLTSNLSRPTSGVQLLYVKSVGVHHLVPGGDEVGQELVLGVVAGIDLCQGPQLGV